MYKEGSISDLVTVLQEKKDHKLNSVFEKCIQSCCCEYMHTQRKDG